MDTKINIAEILKGCPEGTKLWSPLFGEVTLLSMRSIIAVFLCLHNKMKKENISNHTYSLFQA